MIPGLCVEGRASVRIEAKVLELAATRLRGHAEACHQVRAAGCEIILSKGAMEEIGLQQAASHQDACTHAR